MAHINWDQPFTFAGISAPTYGNWGGPGYSGGSFSGTGTAAPVDPLDQSFMEHDLGQLSDVGLVDAIVDLKPHTVDAEGSVYGGVAALVMIEQIETANPTA